MNFYPSLHSKPFDVEVTFAKIALQKKKQGRSYRGPDSPLYIAFWPLIYIVKIFGFGPYKFRKDRLAPSNLYLIFSFLCLGIYSYVMYTVFRKFTGLKRDRPVLGATETLKVIFNFLVAVYDTVLTIFTKSKFVGIWNTLQDFDETVSRLGYPRKETKTALVAWSFVIIQTLIWTAVNQIGMYAFLEQWVYNVGYMWPYIGTSVSVYKFAGVAYFLGRRFQHLNEIAVKNLPAMTGRRYFSNVTKLTVQKLHNDLLVASESLNSLYSWSLFLWLGNLCIHTVSNLYFVIDWVLLSTWEHIQWALIFCLSAWLMSFIAQLLTLHIVCDYTATQANSIAAILLTWNLRLIKDDPVNGIVETSLHLMNRRLYFSAAGCFDVCLPLLRSIVALLTTYLVILLQLP